jgi:hypothetical protein
MFKSVLAAVCLLLAGCAASPEHEAYPEALFSGALDFERALPVQAASAGWVNADVTLVDLDEKAARQLLGIEEANDIAPRAFAKPVAEQAAAIALWYGAGEVHSHQAMSLQLGNSAPLELKRELVSVTSRESGGHALQSRTVGIWGDVRISAASLGGWTIQADLHSVQPGGGQTFTTSFGKDVVKVPIAEVVQVHRVAVETVGPGETAVFQLSRAMHGDTARIRLLFVRIAE